MSERILGSETQISPLAGMIDGLAGSAWRKEYNKSGDSLQSNWEKMMYGIATRQFFKGFIAVSGELKMLGKNPIHLIDTRMIRDDGRLVMSLDIWKDQKGKRNIILAHQNISTFHQYGEDKYKSTDEWARIDYVSANCETFEVIFSDKDILSMRAGKRLMHNDSRVRPELPASDYSPRMFGILPGWEFFNAKLTKEAPNMAEKTRILNELTSWFLGTH